MQWEFSFLYALQELHSPVMDQIMIFITQLGDSGAFWIGIALVCCVMKKHRKMGIQVLVTMLFTFLIGNLILKNLVARPRPCAIDPSIALLIPHPSEYSFPSGHSMNGMAAAMAIFFNNKKAGVPAILMACLIAFSRMYHFVHFPTDILGGFCVGFAVAIVVDHVLQRVIPNLKEKSQKTE